jgi:hypothetical protein
MAITKTKFINFIRCPRYVALDDLKKERLESNVSLEEYKSEEQEAYLQELLDDMYDEEDNDLIEEVDEQLEVMLPYYNQVEIEAAKVAHKYFDGELKYSKSTYNQESFDMIINGIKYLCYVDILNDRGKDFDVIEVKATTSKRFLGVGATVNKEFVSIFAKNEKGIYTLLEKIGNVENYMPEDKYYKAKAKLYDRFNGAGHYVYDLAVQRYIIEKDLEQNNMKDKIPNIKYYLGVLNSDYVYNGTIVNGVREYVKDENNNEIVTFIDFTEITKDMLDIIDLDRKQLERYIEDLSINPVLLGQHCEHNKTTKCKYMKICWKHLPKKNSIMNYIGGHNGFQDELKNKYDRFDLLNDGMVDMLDVPLNYLNRNNNVIQRKTITSNKPYIDLEKIKAGLSQIVYPIYHLDFETFPCPLPRYYGEKCYTQSVFQFSLHIEKEPGICDKDKDHYEFLAKDHEDNRELLVEKMCELIDVNSPGTILSYNESFEKTRLKELGNLFPKYKLQLNKMRDMMFDLMYIVKTKSSLYEELGFDEERAKLFNYYHKDMSGSFSIKKILPLFSDLTYTGLEVSNGVNAIVTYANFPKLSKADYEHKYQKLIEYCKQDTWAMVEILRGLSKL